MLLQGPTRPECTWASVRLGRPTQTTRVMDTMQAYALDHLDIERGSLVQHGSTRGCIQHLVAQLSVASEAVHPDDESVHGQGIASDSEHRRWRCSGGEDEEPGRHSGEHSESGENDTANTGGEGAADTGETVAVNTDGGATVNTVGTGTATILGLTVNGTLDVPVGQSIVVSGRLNFAGRGTMTTRPLHDCS